ncbi:MAG: c-type cytochrome [Maribacter sp.]|nr:c-type cytochrome [Maribacter sp.]
MKIPKRTKPMGRLNFNRFYRFILSFCIVLLVFSCQPKSQLGSWDYEIDLGDERSQGVLKFKEAEGDLRGSLVSFDWGTRELKELSMTTDKLTANISLFGEEVMLTGDFEGDSFSGNIKTEDGEFSIVAKKQSNLTVEIDRSTIQYTLGEAHLPDVEKDIDHAGIIADADRDAFKRGERIYSSNCINCHGNQEVEGSIPLSTKFWEQELKAGNDYYSMYKTITMGYANMPPQPVLTPQEKYDVITYVREKFIKQNQKVELVPSTPGYLVNLPKGNSRGPEIQPYQPWADMDYGNFFINTYELVDAETGLERYHSPRPAPYADEDYLDNNFAYKGIAVRLDEGSGGISKGKSWMIFDHDLMRVAGGWTGEGFIDWNGILLNDKHETYPRTVGKLHFETPVGPGWANPETGSFEDPRFRARDGRAFGPLPKKWADYKGLYHHENNIIISYSVGTAEILERLGMEEKGQETVFTRTLNISPSNALLKMKVAPVTNKVAISGKGATLSEEEGYVILSVQKGVAATFKLFIAHASVKDLTEFASASTAPESLAQYISGGGKAHYPEEIKSVITTDTEDGLFAVDLLTPPFDNPWACRMKLSGIDFMEDSNKAVACATDGDIWLITGLTDGTNELTWQRIGSGLFQPLGIKVLDDKIYVICRDQLVLLQDFNGDNETDFYESFNHDHQVTDHFHEFAMGLQADKQGNLYYAKSGRHAREALIPQHGTLLKVSKDGAKTDIIATGFRAANGVCINPDGSFLVTDQQGFWNPMNRINWVDGKGKFYGNMWGYNPPKDSTRLAMQKPMVWVDMQFDRSPSELLWVDSPKWGALNGSLLSFSYGFGKIQLVLNEKVGGQMQGGVIDLPDIKFLTGVMRGRFNSGDGQLYACGMSAWGTNQMLRGGGLYRIRYTGKPLTVPIDLKATTSGITLKFDSTLDVEKAIDIQNYKVKTWRLVRSRSYGSDRYDEQELNISEVQLTDDGKGVVLRLDEIKPTDVMTISYDITNKEGISLKGTVQNTIHSLGNAL